MSLDTLSPAKVTWLEGGQVSCRLVSDPGPRPGPVGSSRMTSFGQDLPVRKKPCLTPKDHLPAEVPGGGRPFKALA